ncbi:MAG: glycoside hydrolase domain-containing protein [Mangrovibacterium sp.]
MKQKTSICAIWGFLLILLVTGCRPETGSLYSVADTPWEETFGNHRAVLQVDQPANAALLDILWRRHDRNPGEKRFIIIHESGDTVQNIHRIEVDQERCKLAFGPLKKSGK